MTAELIKRGRQLAKIQFSDTINALCDALEARKHERCRADMYADPPSDCGFPFCGCFEVAERAVQSLVECGWLSDEEAKNAGDAQWNAAIETVATEYEHEGCLSSAEFVRSFKKGSTS